MASSSASPASLTANYPPLRPTERVAIILSLLQPPLSKEVASKIDPDALNRIVETYERMGNVPKPVLLKTIATFVTELRSKSPRVYGGSRRAAELADAIIESAPELEMDNGLVPLEFNFAPVEEDIWDTLGSMEAHSLARMMNKERPSVIAAILSRLPENLGGQVMSYLDESIAVAVAAQMAKAGPLSSTTIEAIGKSLQLRTQDADEQSDTEDEYDPLPRLTALLNRCPVSRQRAVLDPLRADDPEQAEAVEAGLLKFEKLVGIVPRNAAPMIFREVEEGVINVALRHGETNAPETLEFLFSNISQRLAEQIRERIAAIKQPKPDEGELAQTAIVSKLLAWAAEDRLDLNFDDDDEG